MMKRLVTWLADHFSTGQLESLLFHLVSRRSFNLSPAEALRFLFRLDARLYSFQGMKSIEYGEGVHPKHRLMKYHEFFIDRVRSSERVLDIGCGKGELAYDVAMATGAYVVGIDLEAEYLKFARANRSHPRIEYRQGNVLQISDFGRFDVVILSNVLEHLPDRPAFLARIVSEVQPKRFLIRVPHFEREWRVPLKKELGVEWRLDPTHETEYTVISFLDEMKSAGLKVESLESIWGELWAVAARDPALENPPARIVPV